MAKVVCPHGHSYDTDIYGERCPLCPAPEGYVAPATTEYVPLGDDDPNTGVMRHVAKPVVGAKHEEPVVVKPAAREVSVPVCDDDRTMVVRSDAGGQEAEERKRLVGFLVTYTHDADGQAWNLYEGRNVVGRKQSMSDICVACDGQISGRHMSVTYRGVDGRFFFRDEQSANGTFLNGVLMDDGELHSGDVLRAGVTEFVLVTIPR